MHYTSIKVHEVRILTFKLIKIAKPRIDMFEIGVLVPYYIKKTHKKMVIK